jgi:hypothetical protein
MGKRIIVTVVCSALGLINASGFAMAETLGKLECSVVGALSQEPIGDKDGWTSARDGPICMFWR